MLNQIVLGGSCWSSQLLFIYKRAVALRQGKQ